MSVRIFDTLACAVVALAAACATQDDAAPHRGLEVPDRCGDLLCRGADEDAASCPRDCSGSTSTTLQAVEVEGEGEDPTCGGDVPCLLTPEEGAVVEQNVVLPGCTPDATRGHGFRIAFDWTDVTGAVGYDIWAARAGAAYPIVDELVAASHLDFVSCNSFVADPNLGSWGWRVRAVLPSGARGPWTPTRAFGFEPCRLATGAACDAPD